ncbi:WD repeat-containing protein 97 [Glossophaga mutica]
MEMDVLDTSNPFSVEGDNLTLDSDLYETDSYDILDPGLLKENEASSSEPVSKLFTRSSRWRNMTPSARARQLWLLLRTSLHSFVEKEKRSELRVACLTHGLEPLRRLEVAAGLRSVAQDPEGRRFVVLDDVGCLHLHRKDGWAQEKLLAPIALRGLVAVPGPMGSMGRFVGWGPAGLAILRPDLSLLWLSEPRVGRAPHREPICCLPVPDLGLLLVVEAGGSLALWKFRLRGRCLVPSGSPLQPPPSSTHVLAVLALGPLSPHHPPRCFAAYGSAVVTFDLHTWAVVDVHQELHKTTISDLAYCGEVEAMVTASRDSTVKVWEADWQIRMVFVGHTGPVTALAVLPNTSLVLSASQDGTLRTWDLQAVAQVGQVMLSYWGQDMRSGSVRRLLAPASPGWPVLSLRAGSVELWRLRELYSPLAQLSAPVLHLQVAPALPLPPRLALPARLVCACADGSVYLVSVASGLTVSALLLEPEDCADAVAYCLPRETLWLLTRAGHLVCANAARHPMCVLYRACPPPPPAPRPCCLHLYSHLIDPSSAFARWQVVRQHGGELGHSNTQAWKDKNRYLPVLGHTDGSLSVLEWGTWKTVFHTQAHSPGPVIAISSTWNIMVSSGQDLTVKMWRVFPYAEESLSLLRTFSCCHPALVLSALGKRVTVGFEDSDSATYGLVQFGLKNSQRYDHQPQDDPMDHITGLCCCPTLKLYASSSLDCTVRIWTTDNHLLRLLQLNGAPQALTFCNNSGDLVLALGSRLCLVSHRLYLPTSYLVKKLCQEVPEAVDDPPLPLTSQEPLTAAQRQRLAALHGVSSLRSAGSPPRCPGGPPPSSPAAGSSFVPPAQGPRAPKRLGPPEACPGPGIPTPGCPSSPVKGLTTLLDPYPASASSHRAALSSTHRQMAAPQQPLLEEDLEALVARDHDLQQLRLGQVVPAARSPPSGQQQQEAFDNYLQLIYGPALLGVCSGAESQQLNNVTLTAERETWGVCAPPRAAPSLEKVGVCTETSIPPTALPPQDWGALGQCFPQVTFPIPPPHRGAHIRESQMLARSSLSSTLGLSVDLQLQLEQLPQERPVASDSLSSHLQHRVPLLLERRPKELLSNLRGFFPAAIESYKDLRRPIHFPGWVPNSAVLQRMWPPREVRGPGAQAWLASQGSLKSRGSQQDDWWSSRSRRRHTMWQQKPIHWLDEGEEEEEEEEEEKEDQELDLDWASDFMSPHLGLSQELLEFEEPWAQSLVPLTERSSKDDSETENYLRPHWYQYERSLLEERYGHLPRFLRFFAIQNWFKKLFPIFTLEAYPEVGTVDGLASLFMDLLEEASWEDRVHILHALLRLMPDMNRNLCSKLHTILLYLLNLDRPPSLQVRMQKQFVMLALQLVLACSLDSHEVVLELMSYFLYSPASCRSELKKLLGGLGLQDPEGLLFKEMTTWVQGLDRESKAMLRVCCSQKLEEMIHHLQTETLQPSVAKLSEMLSKVSETSVLSPRSKETLSPISTVSGAPIYICVTSSFHSGTPSLVTSPGESQTHGLLSPKHVWHTRRTLSQSLTPFSSLAEVRLPSLESDALPKHPLLLEQTDWSHSKIMDLEPIDALNYFCELQRVRRLNSLRVEQTESSGLIPRTPGPNAVVPQPRPHPPRPILRLQETKMRRSPQRQRASPPTPTTAWAPQGPDPARGLTAPLASGQMLSRRRESLTLEGPIRTLKLPLPRVEVRPFPSDWPRPARPLPPLLLQPALQRYFLPDHADPDNYS